MLNRLDRYILAQVGRPMAATILITLLALLAERALGVVDLVIGWRGSLVVVFEMLSYLVPHYMGLALPAAFFLGIMLAFSRLAREGELDAMRASGFGLMQMARPLLLAALVLMAFHLVLVSHVQPFSRYAYRAAVYAVTNVSFQALLSPGQFMTLGETTYLVDQLDARNAAFKGIFLYSEADSSGTLALTAESGAIENQGPTSPLLLHLEDGVQQFVPKPAGEAGHEPAQAPVALTARFKQFTSDLRGDEPEAFRPRGENERELTLPELWRWRGQELGGIEPVEIAAELHARIVQTLSLGILPLLALPLALPPPRGRTGYGLVIGIVVLVGYHQVLRTGEAFVDDGEMSALRGLWLPFFALAAGSSCLFWRALQRIPGSTGPMLIERLIAALEPLRARFARHPE